jgi:hypothetical protein
MSSSNSNQKQPVNIQHTIQPKSDQLNADDLIAGPRDITITSVNVTNTEQPVSIHFEGDGGKPYKPCKSMRRVIVRLWGADSACYPARSLRLFCDQSVVFGGAQVGGIRISHASHIDADVTMALTATRAKRLPYTVKPIPAAVDPMVDLRNAAYHGTEALKSTWEALPAPMKKKLKGELDALKTIAAENDQPVNQPETTRDNDEIFQ